MNKEQLAAVQALAENAAVYVQEDGEGMRILACVSEENHFLAEGEETGESYQIDYSEVDLENDMFYRYQLVGMLVKNNILMILMRMSSTAHPLEFNSN
jgi:hypothetical protein